MSITKTSETATKVGDIEHFDFYYSSHPEYFSNGSLQAIRFFLFSLCFSLLVISLVYLDRMSNIIFFTLWGSNINILSLLFSIVAGTKTYHLNKSLRNFTGILCEIALTFQVLITVVYWSILHHFVVTVRIPEI